jgi:sortase (surface protein transpeptidase)
MRGAGLVLAIGLIAGAVAGLGWVVENALPATDEEPPPAVADTVAAQPIGDPQRLEIPAIGVDAGFEPLAIDADGKLAPPQSFDDVGWSVGGPEPGERGTAVVAGHYDTRTGPAVFASLPDLRPGDEVVVTGATGSATFVVERIDRFAKDAVPAAVYAPTDGATLRLITCGGEFDRSTGHYLDNVVVSAGVAPTQVEGA